MFEICFDQNVSVYPGSSFIVALYFHVRDMFWSISLFILTVPLWRRSILSCSKCFDPNVSVYPDRKSQELCMRGKQIFMQTQSWPMLAHWTSKNTVDISLLDKEKVSAATFCKSYNVLLHSLTVCIPFVLAGHSSFDGLYLIVVVRPFYSRWNKNKICEFFQ